MFRSPLTSVQCVWSFYPFETGLACRSWVLPAGLMSCKLTHYQKNPKFCWWYQAQSQILICWALPVSYLIIPSNWKDKEHKLHSWLVKLSSQHPEVSLNIIYSTSSINNQPKTHISPTFLGSRQKPCQQWIRFASKLITCINLSPWSTLKIWKANMTPHFSWLPYAYCSVLVILQLGCQAKTARMHWAHGRTKSEPGSNHGLK